MAREETTKRFTFHPPTEETKPKHEALSTLFLEVAIHLDDTLPDAGGVGVVTVEEIAKVCYEANRAYCEALGDHSFTPWDDAPDWQRYSNIAGVEFHLDNPNAEPDMSHNAWLRHKREDGWKYGPIKDPEKKEHPCMVPFYELPIEQQAKDLLFISITHALLPLLRR